MADNKVPDPAPVSPWWTWAVSYLPEAWKKYVAVAGLALGAWLLLPTIRSVLPEMPTLVWNEAEPVFNTQAALAEVSAAQVASRDDLAGLRSRVEALEKRLTLTTGSVKKK